MNIRTLILVPLVGLSLVGFVNPGLAESDGFTKEPLPQIEADENANEPLPQTEADENFNEPLPQIEAGENANEPLRSAEVDDKTNDQLQKAEVEVQEALNVFEKIMSNPNKRIPAELLAQSEGIAIIPKVFQAGLVFGGRRGTGVMMVRYPDGTWSNPAFVSLTGGSFGLQIGAKSSDIIMVFPSRETVNEVLSKDYDIGGSVTGTAGPVGSTPVDPTNSYSKNKIYTYSRNRGLFGGVTLDGSKLGIQKDRAQSFYRNDSVTTRKIFTDPFVPAPVVVNSLRDALEESETGTFSRY
ncbi:MAG: lipid-binding SYLF domain-containing protein [Thermosynechococcaceae cyanobacterium]